MSTVVADASVIVKWFVEEEHSGPSVRMRDDHASQRIMIVVPAVAPFEVLNALRYSGGFGTDDLIEISRTLDGYQFVEAPLKGDYAEEVARLAMDLGVTVYDASYLALGKVRGIDVYTADEQLLKKVRKKLAFVRHVKDYAGPEAEKEQDGGSFAEPSSSTTPSDAHGAPP